MKKRLVVGISGGSGIPLATELLSQLQKIEEIETHLVYTRGAEVTMKFDLFFIFLFIFNKPTLFITADKFISLFYHITSAFRTFFF